ncbi:MULTISPECIES: hypothetical protein [Actinosynnema]|uniref:hypothetical protein n=1 Tax=Actinosynnema TaxID=40566 RepID=UPI001E65AE95|nr:hypothetical protein [Actinosynnema pretiosum]
MAAEDASDPVLGAAVAASGSSDGQPWFTAEAEMIVVRSEAVLDGGWDGFFMAVVRSASCSGR